MDVFGPQFIGVTELCGGVLWGLAPAPESLLLNT